MEYVIHGLTKIIIDLTDELNNEREVGARRERQLIRLKRELDLLRLVNKTFIGQIYSL
jgi:hypothetical protein